MKSNQKDTFLPLTKCQSALWAGQRINPNVPLHNVVYTFEIEGEIEHTLFEKAFQKLINATDILRMVFSEEQGNPIQTILNEIDFSLELVDFTSNNDNIAVDEWLYQRTLQRMDISKRVFHTALLRTGPNNYIWFLKLHHLVTDAVSNSILYNRMNSFYQNELEKVTAPLQDFPSFSDYIKYENDQITTKSGADSQNYWIDKTKDTLELPQFYGEKLKKSTEARRTYVHLGAERSQKLRDLAKQPEFKGWTEDLTLFNIFLTLNFSYIHRVSGQHKLAIGAPANNRPTRDFQKTAGLFIEVLPLVIEIEEDDTFISIFNRVKVETNAYLRNVSPGCATPSTNASFNAILNYIHADFPDFNGFPTKTEWLHSDHMDSNHALRTHVYDMNKSGTFKIAFDTNCHTFSKATAEEMPNHFLNILDGFLEDFEQSIFKPALLPIEPLESNSEDISSTQFQSILSSFQHNQEQHPNSVSLQAGNEILTYSSLNKKANQLAHYLKNKGVDKQSRVALHFYRSPDYIISILAVLKTGAAFIPVSSDQPAERIKYIISNSQTDLLLSQSELISKIEVPDIGILDIQKERSIIKEQPVTDIEIQNEPTSLAYILYTSGSTGKPKGVLISNGALSNYIFWAKEAYNVNQKSVFPLFTSIGFDLTITSTLLPLVSGGRINIYKEPTTGPDVSLLKVIEDNLVNCIKLTPSHLSLLKDKKLETSYIHTMIVGGEELKSSLAKTVQAAFPSELKIYNEYGPTEATVGCIVSRYDQDKHTASSVPIGLPISNMNAYILDTYKNQVPNGVIGELYLSGAGLSDGYVNIPSMTAEKFEENPFSPETKMYKTGDLGRVNKNGEFEYIGRLDEQVKLRGYRIELADIESNLLKVPEITNCAVVLVENKETTPKEEVVNCTTCGLPSNYPNADFNEDGVCHLCTAFETYKDKTERYFKNDEQLVSLLTSKRGQNHSYDCISLLSGGKDSTYVLARLVNMGLNVLAFTMDNGYISEQAKANVDRIVKKLGVDHIYGRTPHMNEIFVDSLNQHHNVCNGCFKTIYTLSTKIALEKQIPFIVTGLSRGQFFETRLTEELFWDEELDTSKIDDTILEARKLYHQESDAVKRLLDVSIFEDESVFEKVEFVDFYRFSDVSLEEMLVYLKEKAGWIRPTDTGRSTNCLINQVGIYVHKKDLGYSNYSFPYSWDVRLGHKTRNESLEEINEVIDEKEVLRIMHEIGYTPSHPDWENNSKLVAYYTGKKDLSIKKLQNLLAQQLPSYMLPSVYKHLEEMPLTSNGKVDKKSLKNLSAVQLAMDTSYTAPRNEIEELLENIWAEVLKLNKVGVHDNFISLGGHSLAAIRVTARINEEIEYNFPLNKIFEMPTIAEYATYIEETLTSLLEK
ncbi:amino acid adenylation domain-containing protein [Zobellia sp. 1_MG-2023]|uniref:amino acid adenylation domain-containing protein n=1 Tax=Zobellia sp. 1_MG-2023 TaxID=3062626 RepID=UPI0026E471D0|nr:amino acid adenylation domain-containing protein [Zobellia sp. 1_MG-2023]MDO6819760.1 amino acid adenylation domain-containing protein [Zobellia sp. 1_MG-2023]